MERVYHWYQLVDDIAAANDLTTGSQLKMATELSLAIHAGAVQCWKENGDPIRGAIPLTEQRLQRPHLTAAEGNSWLKRNGYLQKWEPVEPVVPPVVGSPDYSILATRGELINAYGRFSGMNKTTFQNLTNSPKLLAARKVQGVGMRGLGAVEPLFCPYEVMLWLIGPKRKKDHKLPVKTGWVQFRANFPKVYNLHSLSDPTDN